MEKDQESLWRLQKMLQKFEKLDESLLDNLKARNFDAIDKTVEAKKEVKRFLADRPLVNVGPDLALKLKMIRDNYGYNIDKFLESLERVTGKTYSQEDEEEID